MTIINRNVTTECSHGTDCCTEVKFKKIEKKEKTLCCSQVDSIAQENVSATGERQND